MNEPALGIVVAVLSSGIIMSLVTLWRQRRREPVEQARLELGLATDAVGVSRQLLDDMRAEQARLRQEMADLRREMAEMTAALAQWVAWSKAIARDWHTVRQSDHPPPPPT